MNVDVFLLSTSVEIVTLTIPQLVHDVHEWLSVSRMKRSWMWKKANSGKDPGI